MSWPIGETVGRGRILVVEMTLDSGRFADDDFLFAPTRSVFWVEECVGAGIEPLLCKGKGRARCPISCPAGVLGSKRCDEAIQRILETTTQPTARSHCEQNAVEQARALDPSTKRH